MQTERLPLAVSTAFVTMDLVLAGTASKDLLAEECLLLAHLKADVALTQPAG